MIAITRDDHTPLYVPNYIATSLQDIDFSLLAKAGVKYVAFDADSTLVPYRGKALTDDAITFLKEQKKYFKDWCIASNRIIDDLAPIGESISAHVIRSRGLERKPKPEFFNRVTDYFQADPSEIVMVGDKIRTDIFGANRAGFKTVWVEYLGKDSLQDRILRVRHIEKYLLKKYL